MTKLSIKRIDGLPKGKAMSGAHVQVLLDDKPLSHVSAVQLVIEANSINKAHVTIIPTDLDIDVDIARPELVMKGEDPKESLKLPNQFEPKVSEHITVMCSDKPEKDFRKELEFEDIWGQFLSTPLMRWVDPADPQESILRILVKLQEIAQYGNQAGKTKITGSEELKYDAAENVLEILSGVQDPASYEISFTLPFGPKE